MHKAMCFVMLLHETGCPLMQLKERGSFTKQQISALPFISLVCFSPYYLPFLCLPYPHPAQARQKRAPQQGRGSVPQDPSPAQAEQIELETPPLEAPPMPSPPPPPPAPAARPAVFVQQPELRTGDTVLGKVIFSNNRGARIQLVDHPLFIG